LPPSEGGEFLEPRGIEQGPDPKSNYKFSEVGHKWSFNELSDSQVELHEVKKSMVNNEIEHNDYAKLPSQGLFKWISNFKWNLFIRINKKEDIF